MGALLEIPEEDALVGNTSRCIIGDFFYRSRVGDRFFYDNDKQPGYFTKGKSFTSSFRCTAYINRTYYCAYISCIKILHIQF